MRELPSDLRSLQLRYAGYCRVCGEYLPVGEDAFWSPTRHYIYCHSCVRYLRSWEQFVADQEAGRPEAVPPVRPAGREELATEIQRRWRRLCTYLRQSVLAEAADSLARYENQNLWFLQDGGAAQLVIGNLHEVEAPESLQRVLSEREDRQSFMYGWPTVVAPGFDNNLHVAPLFVIPVDPVEPENEGERWLLHARQEAELNLAVLAGELFPLELAAELDAEMGEALPHGAPVALAELAERLATVMGLSADGLNPLDLMTEVPREAAVHNAATIVVTNGFGFSHSVQQELVSLAVRSDWRKTAAAHLLAGGFEPDDEPAGIRELLAAPIEVDASQEKVLKAVRDDPLTVVTGPPGTGKSQLVVNIVANAWLDGESVLVASNNNAAVDVATGRAVDLVAQALLVRTGRRQNRDLVPELVSSAVVQAETFDGDEAVARAALDGAARERQNLLEALEKLGPAETAVFANSRSLEITAVSLWGQAPAPELELGLVTIQRRAERLIRARWFVKWRTRWLFRRLGCFGEGRSVRSLLEWAIGVQHRPNLITELEKLESIVGDPAISVPLADDKWRQASHAAVQARIANSIQKGSGQLAALGSAGSGFSQLRGAIQRSLDVLSGWSCTAMSMQANFRLEADLFDLVVVDEASQCNLAVILPLAYRAKRLVVVGDPNQLSPIISVGDRQLERIADISGLDDEELAASGIHHKKGSAFTAFESAVCRVEDGGQYGTVRMLNEHYRCHPVIARWFNEAFYSDSLHVLTDISKMTGGPRGIFWQDVEGFAERPPRSGRSWINEDEARAAVDQVRDVLRRGELSVGVVTPFAAQARHIERLVEAEVPGGREVLASVGFISGSAFRLQGNEKDVIIFSPVLAPNISDHGSRWVERERQMINVAVSRARQLLVIVGHPDMERWGGPTLTSLRDYATSVVEDPGSVRWRTDSESEQRLLRAMREGDLTPQAKVLVEGFELDFAIQGADGWLNVEVDGDQHIDDRGQQIREDVVRDRILQSDGWRVLRIKAWRCWTDLNQVVEEIKRTLETQSPPP